MTRPVTSFIILLIWFLMVTMGVRNMLSRSHGGYQKCFECEVKVNCLVFNVLSKLQILSDKSLICIQTVQIILAKSTVMLNSVDNQSI